MTTKEKIEYIRERLDAIDRLDADLHDAIACLIDDFEAGSRPVVECPLCTGLSLEAFATEWDQICISHAAPGCGLSLSMRRADLPLLSDDDIDDSGFVDLRAPGLAPLIARWNRLSASAGV